MRSAKALCKIAVLAAVVACQGGPAQKAGAPAGKAAAPAPAPGPAPALIEAELRRDSAAVGSQSLSSRDVSVRRLAARALARIADARAADWLLLALADEDPEVISWGAYGLGYACRGRETKTVPALVLRAASLPSDLTAAAIESPIEAISDALGRCAGAEAESTLRAWLAGPAKRAEAAAQALGRIATQSGKLEDPTLVALLDAADRGPDSLTNALYPLGRLASFNPSTSERARALSKRVVEDHSGGSEFAVRALGRTGPEGVTALGTLLTKTDLAPGLRAQATRELSLLGATGQHALWTAFDASGPEPLSDEALRGANYGPLGALIDALELPPLGSASKLRKLAELPVGPGDSASLQRRKLRLRCAAAALLAGSNFQSPQLLACDPAKDSALRELGVLRAIGREPLRGARKRAYLSRARSETPAIREAALDLLAPHAELAESYQVLAEALGAKSLGIVASAARVLARYPERATRAAARTDSAHSAPNPDPSVVQALTRAYGDAGARNSVEVQSLLLDALGALQILTAKDAANAACSSDNPTLREHAQRALRLLGEQSRRCDDFKPGPDAAPPNAASGQSRIAFETEAGPLSLSLDPALAPSAVQRIVLLAKAGFYDGLTIHRVVPGFVAQFGDPTGDGYGGDERPPLRCETSPVPFEVGSVGVALSGRDTGSSQLFVTLGRYPHLDGDYAWLGQAGPGWDRVAAGDRILRAVVSSVP